MAGDSLDSLLGLGEGGKSAPDDPEQAGVGLGPVVGGLDDQGVPDHGFSDQDGGVEPEVSDGVEGFARLPVDSIRPNEYQPRRRFDEEELAALTGSIRELGVLQPVLVRHIDRNRYELIAGERRWRAARRAGLTVIPAVVRRADDLASLEQAVVENLHRSDLNAIEEAAAYRQLIDEFDLTQEEVAQRVGKSRSGVTNTLRLLQLSNAVQRMVTEGALSAGHARALLALQREDDQIALAGRIVDEGLNVRQVERAVRSLLADADDEDSGSSGEGGEERAPVRSALVNEVESLMSDLLDTRVEVVEQGRRGRLVVEFADEVDLDRIARLLLENRR